MNKTDLEIIIDLAKDLLDKKDEIEYELRKRDRADSCINVGNLKLSMVIEDTEREKRDEQE